MSDKNGTVNCRKPGCNKEIPAASAVYIKEEPYCPNGCSEWAEKFFKKMALISTPLTLSINDKFKSEKLNSVLGLKSTKYRTHL
ncbi:MAG: hypothetical protein KAU24_04090 [Candidatus Aenigmarchaeota archaeon]|nr:hypothetical protein [Candidatus Aenigmarchaeota archaeon]